MLHLPSFLFVLSVDATKYTGSVHHQVNSNLAAAAQVQWTSGTSNTALTVAGKYTIDSDTFVKVSIFQFSVCFSKWQQRAIYLLKTAAADKQ